MNVPMAVFCPLLLKILGTYIVPYYFLCPTSVNTYILAFTNKVFNILYIKNNLFVFISIGTSKYKNRMNNEGYFKIYTV